jgi:hypothetical protein
MIRDRAEIVRLLRVGIEIEQLRPVADICTYFQRPLRTM